MSIPIPVGMELATVTWQLGHTTQTETLAGARGLVRFEPTATAVSYPDTTVLPTAVTARVTGGVMEPVELTVNDPDIWNWRVTPEFGLPWVPFHIDVTSEGVDLATAAVVPGKGPVRAVTGPRGFSIVDVDEHDGEVEFILENGARTTAVPLPPGPVGPANQLTIGSVASGEDASATISGTAPQQSLSLTLPKGDQGDRGPRGPEGPYGGTEVTDPQVASYVTTETETRAALDRSYAQGVTVTAHGAIGDGVANDRPAIQAAVDLAASLGVDVILPAGKSFRTNSHITLGAPVRVRGYGATIRAEGGASALNITSSYVTVEGVTIVGNGAGAFKAAERGILSIGTAANPFRGCHIKDVTVRAMGDTAIRCDWWTDSSITGGRLHDLAYAGIIAQSAQRLRIDGVAVEDVHQHAADQSYGISVTDSVNTVQGRSRDVTVNGCSVTNVAKWTGISTHGGERIAFTNNRVLGCHRGIVYGAGNPSRVVTATDGLVTGNIIDGAGVGGSVGLAVIGQSTGASSTAFRSSNLVKNHARLYEASTNGVWLDDTEVLKSDPGFPVAAADVTTTEVVVDRVTLPPSTLDRRASIATSVYTVSTVAANRCDVRIYAGSSVVGRGRRALPGGSLPETLSAVGVADIPASDAPTVIEVRVALNSGGGTMTTSASNNLTTTAVIVAVA